MLIDFKQNCINLKFKEKHTKIATLHKIFIRLGVILLFEDYFMYMLIGEGSWATTNTERAELLADRFKEIFSIMNTQH